MGQRLLLLFLILDGLFHAGSSVYASPKVSGIVVRSRAKIKLSKAPKLIQRLLDDTDGTQPISIDTDPDSFLKLDNGNFEIPVASNGILDFRTLAISYLFDNNLDVCGPWGDRRCTKAMIRIYTVDADGPGVYNDDACYGAPLFVGRDPLKLPTHTVAWGPEDANLMQSFTIQPNRHTVKLSDFGKNLIYHFAADFSDAGVGHFATTIVIEYALAP